MLKSAKNQAGVTLVEMMIGLALSMIVVSSMVLLMSNSLASASRIIQMTQLTDDLRNSMSMVSRDIRRANYSANAYRCYANSDCGADGSANQVNATIESDCLIFNLDRDQDGDATEDDAGGFRLVDNGSGIGVIEMWVGDNNSADCSDTEYVDGDDWISLTDPEFVDFTQFEFTLNNIAATLTEKSGATITQNTRELFIEIEAELILDRTVTRRIEDNIKVRNDYLVHTAP